MGFTSSRKGVSMSDKRSFDNHDLNEFGVSDKEVDDWVFKEEAHYHHTIQDVAELISVYGWHQVLQDILTAEIKL